MYELKDAETNKLIMVGTVEQIAEYTKTNVTAVYSASSTKGKLKKKYLVKRLWGRTFACKMFDVYQNGKLVYEYMSPREIAAKLFITVNAVYANAKRGRATQYGYTFVESKKVSLCQKNLSDD